MLQFLDKASVDLVTNVGKYMRNQRKRQTGEKEKKANPPHASQKKEIAKTKHHQTTMKHSWHAWQEEKDKQISNADNGREKASAIDKTSASSNTLRRKRA